MGEGSVATAAQSGRVIRGLGPEARREQRRVDLLKAATVLFADHGFQQTTIEQICQSAYVSTKGFYEHFATKEECLLAVFEREVSAAMTFTSELMAEFDATDLDFVTEALVRGLAPRWADGVEAARVLLGTLDGLPRSLQDRRTAHREAVVAFMAEVMEQYLPPGFAEQPGRRESIVVVCRGALGGALTIVTDWLAADEPRPELLVEQITTYYRAVRWGIEAFRTQDPATWGQVEPGT